MTINKTNKALSFADALAKYIIKKRGIGLSRLDNIKNQKRKANIQALYDKAFPKTAFQKNADSFFEETRDLMKVALGLSSLFIALGASWTLPIAASTYITSFLLTELIISMLELTYLLWTAHLDHQQLATLESKGIIHFNNEQPLLLDTLNQKHNVSNTTNIRLEAEKNQNAHIKTLAHARDIAVSVLDTEGAIATFMKNEVLVKIALKEKIQSETRPTLLNTPQGDTDTIDPHLILELYQEHAEKAFHMINNLNTIFKYDQREILSVINSDTECSKAFQSLKEKGTGFNMQASTFEELSGSIAQLRIKLENPNERVHLHTQVMHTLSNGIQNLCTNTNHFFREQSREIGLMLQPGH